METIRSFEIDHLKLKKGLYVSRKDEMEGCRITTYDIRMRIPYREVPMKTGTLHAIEHLGATYLRNYSDLKDKVIYFGPMGCRTGFYLVLKDFMTSRNLVPYLKKLFIYIASFNDQIPGATKSQCGNFEDMDLKDAKVQSLRYLNVLENIKRKNLLYPSEYFTNDDELISLFLHTTVEVTVDRPIGYKHTNIIYPINYGFVENKKMADEEFVDAYILGETEPIRGTYIGKVIAGIKREDDIEIKLIVSNQEYSDEEILKQVNFVEKYFISHIVR